MLKFLMSARKDGRGLKMHPRTHNMLRDRITLGIPEFCQIAGISRAFSYVLRKRGMAPEYIKVGRRILIPHDAIDAWLKSNPRA